MNWILNLHNKGSLNIETKKPNYRWKIKFELGNAELEGKNEIKRTEIHLIQKNKDQINGEILFTTDSPNGQISKIADEKLSNFLNLIALYHFDVHIDETLLLKNFSYGIDNVKELLDARLKVPTVGTLKTSTNIILTQDFIDKIPERLKELSSSIKTKNLEIILKQYRLAYSQDNVFIRYQQLWITFMMLIYSLNSNTEWDDKKTIINFACGATSTLKKKDVDNILKNLMKSAGEYHPFLGLLMFNEKCKNWFELLINMQIPHFRNPSTYSQELQLLVNDEVQGKEVNPREKLAKVLFCFYGIRNQLFHWTPYASTHLNEERMKLSCFALALVIRISLDSYINKFTKLASS